MLEIATLVIIGGCLAALLVYLFRKLEKRMSDDIDAVIAGLDNMTTAVNDAVAEINALKQQVAAINSPDPRLPGIVARLHTLAVNLEAAATVNQQVVPPAQPAEPANTEPSPASAEPPAETDPGTGSTDPNVGAP